MAVRIERLNYGNGWQNVFYVAENENPSPSVSCYSPDGAKLTPQLRLLDIYAEVYTFKFYFGRAGKYVFIYFESGQAKLIAIITVRRNARN